MVSNEVGGEVIFFFFEVKLIIQYLKTVLLVFMDLDQALHSTCTSAQPLVVTLEFFLQLMKPNSKEMTLIHLGIPNNVLFHVFSSHKITC